MNIFVEGLQGTGKSTLLGRLRECFPDLPAYREGDVCPVELAWCAYLTEGRFADAKSAYPEFAQEMESLSVREGGYVILPYTRVKGNQAFFADMERREIYNGRIPLEQFRATILRRYAAHHGSGLFECALLQNIVETMLLYYCEDEERILDFYREIWACLKGKDAVVLYLDATDIVRNIDLARKERVDDAGKEVWFAMLMEFFRAAPLSKRNGWTTGADLATYMHMRQHVERRILQEIVGESAIILSEKQYRMDEVLSAIHNALNA